MHAETGGRHAKDFLTNKFNKVPCVCFSKKIRRELVVVMIAVKMWKVSKRPLQTANNEALIQVADCGNRGKMLPRAAVTLRG